MSAILSSFASNSFPESTFLLPHHVCNLSCFPLLMYVNEPYLAPIVSCWITGNEECKTNRLRELISKRLYDYIQQAIQAFL